MQRNSRGRRGRDEEDEARIDSRATAAAAEDVDDNSSEHSSAFSTESGGNSEYEEIMAAEQGENNNGEASAATLVDAGQKNAALPCVFNPHRDDQAGGVQGEGEMVYDPAAYAMLHRMTLEWPALSFDFFPGPESAAYPMAAGLALGTQTANDSDNQLHLLRIHNMYRTYQRDEDEAEGDVEQKKKWEADQIDEEADDDSVDEDSDVEDEIGLRDPRIDQLVSFDAPTGSVNRVRVCRRAPFVAMWAGNEVRVHAVPTVPNVTPMTADTRLVHRFCAGAEEGFALDWAKTSHHPTLLVCGNREGILAVCKDVTMSDAATTTVSVGYSIEDVETSPTQPNVFMAGGTNGIVEVFDLRDRLTAKMRWTATAQPKKKKKSRFIGTDVNVIAWHPMEMTSHLVATGGDDAALRVWDLRQVMSKGAESPDSVLVNIQNHHSHPVTSVQWSPHNENVCAMCTDTEVGIYDFSLERDFQEEFEMLSITNPEQAPAWLHEMQKGGNDADALPEQLLFEHGGLSYAKEVRFHPTVPGLFGVAHEEGLHVFRPCNWKSLMQ
eukprot:PhM_4_TR18271/c0_g1_i1/m.20142/K14848/RRB1, GRWD1; ribosome assembly protein RRB1